MSLNIQASQPDQDVIWAELTELGYRMGESRLDELFAVYATSEQANEWLRVEAGTLSVLSTEASLSAWKASLQEWEIELPMGVSSTEAGPLDGWRVALDPGHLGGKWGPMESRSFRIGDGAIAQEGDLVLAAARHLQVLLEEAGAEVLLLRDKVGPVTERRPEDFLTRTEGMERSRTQDEANRFFLREDIRARSVLLEDWGAHVVFAMHINASSWPDPDNHTFLEANHGHVLVNGAYLDNEVGDATQRLEMLRRWLLGYHRIELEIATAVAESMVEATGLEPYTYTGPNAVRVNENPYVWGRNLMASRIYPAPVVYLEPWVLNSAEVYPWGSLGDYEGLRMVDGKERVSLPRVYADFVAQGLLRFVEGPSR